MPFIGSGHPSPARTPDGAAYRPKAQVTSLGEPLSNTRKAADTTPEFSTPNGGKRKVGKDDLFPFRLDGERYEIVRPKTLQLVQVGRVMDPDEWANDEERAKAAHRAVYQMIGWIKEPGRETIAKRLADSDDSLDFEHLMPILKAFLGEEDDTRPTGARPASSRAPRRTSPSSRARTRSTPAAT